MGKRKRFSIRSRPRYVGLTVATILLWIVSARIGELFTFGFSEMKSAPFQTKIPEKLKPFKRIPFCTYRKYRPCYPDANSLLVICESIVNFEPEPSFWNLTAEEVAEYVSKEWNHDELKEPFLKNNINGKALLFLEADRLPRMGIKQFDVIKELTSQIRDLCKIEKEDPNRGISLPPRLPYTLYMFYKALRTGPTSYYMTPKKYFKKINIIRDETCEDRQYYALLNHWKRIPPYRPWCPHVLVGGIRRINPMTGTTQRQVLLPGRCKCKTS